MTKLVIPRICKILVLTAALSPLSSKAAFYVLDSGTPTGSGAPLIVSSTASVAGEFSAQAGETITELSAYLSSVSGNGNSLIYDIYSGTFIGSHAQKTLLDSVTATFTGTGWTSASVNWVVPATGNYWFAIEGNGVGTTYDVPLETSTTTGTVPALEFATGSSGTYTAYSNGVGFQVTAVPEPATYGSMAGAGLFALSAGSLIRRKLRGQPKISLPFSIFSANGSAIDP